MNFLFRKVNIASLVFFRIVFGVLGFADVLSSWIGKHFIDRAFQTDNFQFKYYGFEWVKTFPDPWLSAIFVLTMFSGLFIAVGKWYRISAFIFALGFSYIYFLEKSYYLNHGYLTMVISWLIIFMPLHRNYSLDALGKIEWRKSMVPYWPLFTIQFLMGVVYFYGGIAKINPDWLNGMPMKIWLAQKSNMPILGFIWEKEFTAYFMSYSGMLLDLLVVFFLIKKKTRIWALGFVLFFHLNNLILFKIGIFPFLSVALTLMYFEPDFPIQIWHWFEKKLPGLQSFRDKWKEWFNPGSQPELVYTGGPSFFIKSGTVLLMAIMLLLPFRHHLFKGNVAWTEEGHRYSWRMMLRQKSAYGSFIVKNTITNAIEKVNPKHHLTKRQLRKMRTHPEMILQFAHYLSDVYSEKYGCVVEVYTDIKAKLNGRQYQVYIDPEVDLAKEKFEFFKSADWILPLKTEEEQKK